MALLRSVYQLLQDGKFCDVHLITENGDIIKAHACILASASETLKKWIENGNFDVIDQVRKVYLPSELTTKVVKYLIHLIYQEEVHVNVINRPGDTAEPVSEEELLTGTSKLGLKLSVNASKSMIKIADDNTATKIQQSNNDTTSFNNQEVVSLPSAENKEMIQLEADNSDLNCVSSADHDSDPAIVNEKHQVNKFVCSVCKKICRTLRTLKLHEKLHRVETVQALICQVCGKSFRRRTILEAHLRKSHNDHLSCSQFSQLFSDRREKHRRKLPRAKRTSCSICNKSFTNEYVMQLHTRTHTGDELYCCATCGKKFPYKSSLNTHSLIHTGLKPYICSICGRSFTQKIHAKEHESQHSVQKRFSCNECKKTFAHKSGLDRHVSDVHHKNRPYVCETCGKAFPRKTKLIEHTRIHTGEKPYVCGVCGMAYKSNRSLKNHKKSRHGIITSLDDTSFDQKSYVNVMASHPQQNSWPVVHQTSNESPQHGTLQYASTSLPLTIRILDKGAL